MTAVAVLEAVSTVYGVMLTTVGPVATSTVAVTCAVACQPKPL